MHRALLVAAMCVAAGCGGSDDSAGCHEGETDITTVYAASGLKGGPPPAGAVDGAVRVMCERARKSGMRVSVRRQGGDRIAVGGSKGEERELAELTVTGQLAFYDWEPNVFGNPYQPVNDLGQAIRRATKAKPRDEATDVPDDRGNDTIGDKYYSLGPERKLIVTQRPPRAGAVEVPRGVAIVKAELPEGATENTPTQFFVIEDDAELSGSDLEDPAQNFDGQTQEPIVTMEFTERGKAAFARVTKRIAERGQSVLPQPGQPPEDRFQRFMIALDGQIVSLAAIDFIRNPEGIDGETGVQINGIGSIEDTENLAHNLRIGALPVRLEPVR